MMKTKYLVIVDNLTQINELKEIGIKKFLFPLKFFSVGFNNYFEINDLKVDNAYLFINKILNTKSCEELKKLLNNLPPNIKGIVFDDLGVIEISQNLKIEKILYNNHFNTNYESINEFLKYSDTIVISTEITLEEIKEILNKSIKPLTIFGFGHINISYSGRKLLSNYADYHNLEKENNLKVENTDYKFLLNENDFGTVIYENQIFNGLEEIKKLNNIKYILINSFNIPITELKTVLDTGFTKLDTTKGFLFKKTIYKLKGDNDV